MTIIQQKRISQHLSFVALVESPEHVCCRYRLKAFQKRFTEAGIGLSYQIIGNTFREFANDLSHLSQLAGIILQRKLIHPWNSRRLRKKAKLFVLDFDDAIWLRDSFSPKGLYSRKRRNRFNSLLEKVDGVVVGNSFLAEEVSRNRPALACQIIPTCLDTDKYKLASHERTFSDSEAVRLVWVGSSSTIQGLEQQKELLQEVGKKLPGLVLTTICDRPLELHHLKTNFVPWSEEIETVELSNSDIGISWIPYDDWSRGKCGLKILQYMAAGLPVVTNSVGVHREMVIHGQTGFLADTKEEWLEAIRILARDPELRNQMGRRARQMVEQKYHIDVGSQLWIDFLSRFESKRCSA